MALVQNSPWTRHLRTTVAVTGGVGVIVIVVGWWLTHDTADFGDQLGATVLALGGLGLVVLAVAGWVLAGRRRLEGRLRALAAIAAPVGSPAPHAGPGGADGNGHKARSGLPVATTAMLRFHHPTCLMVTGKTVTAASAASHAEAGRQPCEVCKPDA